MDARVARLEHELLSPEFIAWLREADDLGHTECDICQPPIYDAGIDGRMWTKALDCPMCGVQVRRGARVLVQLDYSKHLAIKHERGV